MKAFVLTMSLAVIASAAGASVQTAWTQRYSAGRTKGTNEAVAMALDHQGNVVVAGSSRGTAGDFDYVVLKYAPSGSNVWVRRFTSAGNSDDRVRALQVDTGGNVYVTGTSVTIKYDPEGAPLWTAPFGGRSLACDTNENVYVTGCLDEDFATVKLSSTGSNLWARTYDLTGKVDVAQQVIVGGDGNVYVAGTEVWAYEPRQGVSYNRYRAISYTPEGSVRFSSHFPDGYYYTASQVRGLHLTEDSLILTGNLSLNSASGVTFCVAKLDLGTGLPNWFSNWVNTSDVGESACWMAPNGDIFMTGGLQIDVFRHTSFRTVKVRADQLGTIGEGIPAWQADYSGQTPGYNRANAIALDSADNIYVAGQSTGAGTETDWQDWATIKYSPDGMDRWVKRYNGPAQLNDVATCMAVTASGEVYVAGWSAASSNLTELVIIKYAELQNIQVQPDKRTALQFFGTPGQSYRIDASTNLAQWQPLGVFTADFTGIYRYVDGDAPNFSQRFYRTAPQ
jgi:hypothetical protein